MQRKRNYEKSESRALNLREKRAIPRCQLYKGMLRLCGVLVNGREVVGGDGPIALERVVFKLSYGG